MEKLKHTLEMVKFSHSLFAMPFALLSFALAHRVEGLSFSPLKLLLIVLAMATARNAAMAWNRLVDAPIDALNPRTADRHLPKGLLSRRFAIGFTAINASLFVLICFFINPLSLYLSPFALAIIGLYSFAKRATVLSHFVLGIALAIAPIGAWIAASGELHPLPFWIGGGVLFWVAGFDILYALQDADFDRKAGLHAIPARFGLQRAIEISRFSHLGAILTWAIPIFFYPLGPLYPAALGAMALFLLYEHSLVSAHNLSRLNQAFFTANAVGALIFSALAIAGILLTRTAPSP